MSTIAVREATLKDASLLARLGHRTFVEAFVDDNDPVQVANYASDAFSSDRIGTELADPAAAFLIASVDGVDVGYAKIVADAGQPWADCGNPFELERIYVLQDAIGTGVGRALMTVCLEIIRSRGGETVWLGVWERNDRAIRFYERFGFETVGEKTFQLGGEPQRDVVMVKRLNV